MPIEFDDPTAMTPITRRVLMLCDRWSDWTNGRAIINQQLALGLCSYGAVEVYRSVHSPQRKCATLPVIAMINVLRGEIKLPQLGYRYLYLSRQY